MPEGLRHPTGYINSGTALIRLPQSAEQDSLFLYGCNFLRHYLGVSREVFTGAMTSMCGQVEEGTAKGPHARALKKVKDEAKKNKQPELKRFEPYCLRHPALTRLAEAGCDAFTRARIAGHSSITITQRYCHPQADAIERAFQRLALPRGVVTLRFWVESCPSRNGHG